MKVRYGDIPNGGNARFDEGQENFGTIQTGTMTFNKDLIYDGKLFYDPMVAGYDSIFTKAAMHEIGHGLGLNHYSRLRYPDPCIDEINKSAVMNAPCGANDNGVYRQNIFGQIRHYDSNLPDNIMACDLSQLHSKYSCSLQTPTPTPTPTPEPIECDPLKPDYCWDVFCTDVDPNDCNQCATPVPGECASPQAGCNCSPILIDIQGNGFNLTNAANGVEFDLNGDGIFQSRLGWTAENSDDAWLALDRNGNGRIDNGTELFGNFTPQSESPTGIAKNGFLALAEFDKSENGGNNDEVIDSRDAVFTNLRLWQDANRNGMSESNELHTLASLNVKELELRYHESKRKDEYGNRFKYRAKVWSGKKAKAGRWAWDVFLVSLPINNGITEYSLNTKFDGMQWMKFAGILDKKTYSKCGS